MNWLSQESQLLTQAQGKVGCTKDRTARMGDINAPVGQKSQDLMQGRDVLGDAWERAVLKDLLLYNPLHEGIKVYSSQIN